MGHSGCIAHTGVAQGAQRAFGVGRPEAGSQPRAAPAERSKLATAMLEVRVSFPT